MVEQVSTPIHQIQTPPPQKLPLIEERDIKAILYMGLRGDIVLPVDKHKVDILA